MKKDRNCGMAVYPQVVPNFGGAIMPGQMIPMPGVDGGMMSYPSSGMMNVPSGSTTTTQNNYGSSDLNNLTNKVNSLEQRVNRLENLVNNGTYSNGYNSSNFQMM